jgi:hypothetical protein
MGGKVYINGREVVHAGSDGKSVAFPDMCFCPPKPPAGPVPAPLANVVTGKDLKGCSATVFICGHPVALQNSYFSQSSGNEVSKETGGGVLNGAVSGPAYFATYSTNVLIEGQGVARHMDIEVDPVFETRV